MADNNLWAIEYERIKSEQCQRIGFRDNLIFVNLAATGAIFSWVMTNLNTPNALHALLVIPWVCIILGWTYVVNDSHISRIGRYVRQVLSKNIEGTARPKPIRVIEEDGGKFDLLPAFGWESYHRIDSRRVTRKRLQCAIDEITFCVPGAAALIAYCHLHSWRQQSLLIHCILLAEIIFILGLGALIISYSDFGRD